ncbi:unnamed protein product [Toxocara canis]|uniref:DNA-directed DNA polymerase n=1 Tax=Toxocara canis TaxID=6265 RepID=A0A183U4T9_TOXCA|nr:unnamed protein product [Toxocara canis]
MLYQLNSVKFATSAITEYYDTDFNLLRWLIGHNYNLDVILPKLRNHLHFRQSRWNLDKITEQPRNHPVHAFWKCGLTGPALKTPNTIVNVEQTGSNDYWGMLSTFPINELMKARIYDLEMMLKRVMELENETGIVLRSFTVTLYNIGYPDK